MNIDEELRCPICFERFTSPRSLNNCLHTFCEECLFQTFSAYEQKNSFSYKFPCPVCRKTVERPLDYPRVTKDWVKSFPINHVINSMLNIAVQYDGSEPHCEPCTNLNKSTEAVNFCMECQEFMCSPCCQLHKNFKSTKFHELVTVQELKADKKRALDLSKFLQCQLHKDKHVELFCIDDDMPVCVLCVATNHRNCTNVVELKVQAESSDAVEKSKQQQEKMKKLEDSLISRIAQLEQNEEDLNAQEADVKKSIDEKRYEVISVLDAFESTVMKEFKQLRQKKLDNLTQDLTKSKCLLSSVKSSKVTFDTVVKYGSQAHTFVTFRRMKSQLEQYENLMDQDHSETNNEIIRLVYRPPFLNFLNAKIIGYARLEEYTPTISPKTPNETKAPVFVPPCVPLVSGEFRFGASGTESSSDGSIFTFNAPPPQGPWTPPCLPAINRTHIIETENGQCARRMSFPIRKEMMAIRDNGPRTFRKFPIATTQSQHSAAVKATATSTSNQAGSALSSASAVTSLHASSATTAENWTENLLETYRRFTDELKSSMADDLDSSMADDTDSSSISSASSTSSRPVLSTGISSNNSTAATFSVSFGSSLQAACQVSTMATLQMASSESKVATSAPVAQPFQIANNITNVATSGPVSQPFQMASNVTTLGTSAPVTQPSQMTINDSSVMALGPVLKPLQKTNKTTTVSASEPAVQTNGCRFGSKANQISGGNPFAIQANKPTCGYQFGAQANKAASGYQFNANACNPNRTDSQFSAKSESSKSRPEFQFGSSTTKQKGEFLLNSVSSQPAKEGFNGLAPAKFVYPPISTKPEAETNKPQVSEPVVPKPVSKPIATKPVSKRIATKPVSKLVVVKPGSRPVTTKSVSELIATRPFSEQDTTTPVSESIATKPVPVSTNPASESIATKAVSECFPTKPVSEQGATKAVAEPISANLVSESVSAKPVYEPNSSQLVSELGYTKPVYTGISVKQLSKPIPAMALSRPISTKPLCKSTSTSLEAVPASKAISTPTATRITPASEAGKLMKEASNMATFSKFYYDMSKEIPELHMEPVTMQNDAKPTIQPISSSGDCGVLLLRQTELPKPTVSSQSVQALATSHAEACDITSVVTDCAVKVVQDKAINDILMKPITTEKAASDNGVKDTTMDKAVDDILGKPSTTETAAPDNGRKQLITKPKKNESEISKEKIGCNVANQSQQPSYTTSGFTLKPAMAASIFNGKDSESGSRSASVSPARRRIVKVRSRSRHGFKDTAKPADCSIAKTAAQENVVKAPISKPTPSFRYETTSMNLEVSEVSGNAMKSDIEAKGCGSEKMEAVQVNEASSYTCHDNGHRNSDKNQQENTVKLETKKEQAKTENHEKAENTEKPEKEEKVKKKEIKETEHGRQKNSESSLYETCSEGEIPDSPSTKNDKNEANTAKLPLCWQS